MRVILVAAIVFAASIASAQESICGVGFITSKRTLLPIATRTLVEINEDGSRGDVIHSYDDVIPEGSERVDLTAAVFMDLNAAGAYELYCTDLMGLESLPASGNGKVCLRPGTPEIKRD